ncbi:MAG: MarR family transcriptional regulator [Candidatus Altiarchaeota archaeon]
MKALWLFAILLAASSACAQEYYADVSVDVNSAGVATITGRENHLALASRTTDSLTQKRGSYWLFNLTLPKDDVFAEYVYEVNLPEGASVNYVKALGQFRIATDGGRISVRGTGEGEPMSVIIQYQIAAAQKDDYMTYMIAAAIVLLIAAALAYLKLRGKNEEVSYDPKLLTERQKEIMEIIKETGPVNQSLIREKLSLPKSSVSRNVDSLERMGLIKKTRTGMSTMLTLKEKQD